MSTRFTFRIRTLTLLLPVLAAAMMASAAPAQDDAEKPAAEEAKVAYVVLKTNHGEILFELNEAKAPISVKNFLAYTEDKYYDGTIFHRVIPNFMVQGGGFDKDMNQKDTKEPIKNEWQNGLKNEKGTIAMARLGGRADSATSQFFINVTDNAFLDQPRDGAGYAVFGKVAAGMDVVDKIKAVATTTVGPHQNVPAEAVVIETARKVDAAKAKEMIDAEKTSDTDGS